MYKSASIECVMFCCICKHLCLYVRCQVSEVYWSFFEQFQFLSTVKTCYDVINELRGVSQYEKYKLRIIFLCFHSSSPIWPRNVTDWVFQVISISPSCSSVQWSQSNWSWNLISSIKTFYYNLVGILSFMWLWHARIEFSVHWPSFVFCVHLQSKNFS